MKIPKRFSWIVFAVALALAGCDVSVNEDIVVSADGTARGSQATVNGNIIVNEQAVTKGHLKSVNGNIQIRDGAQVADIMSVNGAITIGKNASVGNIDGVNSATECEKNAKVDGNIKLVNGRIRVHEGAVVAGDVKTVNGPIRLVGATVEGDVNNYNGGIVITDNSLVKGNVIVSRPKGNVLEDEPLVVLGPGSEVLGEMTFERPVKLYVHKQASHGAVSGAEPIAFDGTELPGDG